jgi:tRNA nucleotidyltransferase/poly(A) polymerase
MNLKQELSKYKFLKTAGETAEQFGIESFIVGGFIRDLILKRESSEIDFLVIGNGPDYASALAKKLGIKNIAIFKNFGTAHFKYQDFDLEFVGARKESYSSGSRKPEIAAGTFLEDISRRDFTINTLAASLKEENYGEIIDIYKGLMILKRKAFAPQ